jgi:hypothetical protein
MITSLRGREQQMRRLPSAGRFERIVARPSDENVAGFGKLQQAFILRMPANREIAARDRHERFRCPRPRQECTSR